MISEGGSGFHTGFLLGEGGKGGHCVCFNEALSGGWFPTRVLSFVKEPTCTSVTLTD